MRCPISFKHRQDAVNASHKSGLLPAQSDQNQGCLLQLEVTVTVAGCGVAVIVIVTGGGHVELNTLELGLEDVDGVWVETTVLRVEDACEVVEAALVVEIAALELVFGEGEAELELLLEVVAVVVWKYDVLDGDETVLEYDVVT
jgi:hypothetical protein